MKAVLARLLILIAFLSGSHQVKKSSLEFNNVTKVPFLISQLSTPSDPTYKAGVVEHPEAVADNARKRTSLAWQSFQNIIRTVEELDILVFPEHIINSRATATFVPHESENVTPCFEADYDIFLIEASCGARSRGMYLVINLVEKELCGNGAGSKTYGPCPETGVQYFNTNVVFDRTGKVISRYRKTHLWRHEYYETSVLLTPDVATFTTDFGVTFGHFICFDMLFYEPAMTLIQERNITDIIYPTYWFSELPFLGAIQLQEGWAYGNDINLWRPTAASRRIVPQALGFTLAVRDASRRRSSRSPP